MKKQFNSDLALKILKSGYPLNNIEVTDTVNFELLSVNDEVSVQIIIENSVINEIDSWGTCFNEKVTFRNSTFKSDTMFQSCYFLKGLEIENCIFENSISFAYGGHNKTGYEVRVTNNTFSKFVDFNDCCYEGPFIMRDNIFAEGTNILGDWQLCPSFDEEPVIENNKGNLTLVDNPIYSLEKHSIPEKLSNQSITIEFEEISNDDPIDSFLKYIDRFVHEDKIMLIEQQLKTLKEYSLYEHNGKFQKFINILTILKSHLDKNDNSGEAPTENGLE